MSVLGYFSKRQPTTHGDKYYATRDQYDPVLRAHLRLKPPEPQATCPYTGKVKVNGEWMFGPRPLAGFVFRFQPNAAKMFRQE